MSEVSGAAWVARYPTSTVVADLVDPFRANVVAFIAALRAGGAVVTVSATYRPPERAYLMHWCCRIANGEDPGSASPLAGVAIDWTHGGDHGAAVNGAAAMKAGYGIAYPAALISRHTQRRAIDMTIPVHAPLTVRDKGGLPRSVGCQADLWPIGKSFGVIKLVSDPPHWSDDGH